MAARNRLLKTRNPNALALESVADEVSAILDSYDPDACTVALRNYYNNPQYGQIILGQHNINDMIDLYNACELCRVSAVESEVLTDYRARAKVLNSLLAAYFSSLDDDNIVHIFLSVDWLYAEDFWALFDRFKCCGHISDRTFAELIGQPDVQLIQILYFKNTVTHYDSVIADCLRKSPQTAEILTAKFLEKHFETTHERSRIFLPKSLLPSEYEVIFQNYIDSEKPDPGILQVISHSPSRKECPLSDRLRYNAHCRFQKEWDARANKSVDIVQCVSCSFSPNPEIISFKIKDWDEYWVYDSDWIKDNLDYPTLLNNFI